MIVAYLVRRLPESVEGKAVRDVPEVFLHHLQNLVAGPQSAVLVGRACRILYLSINSLQSVHKNRHLNLALLYRGLRLPPPPPPQLLFWPRVGPSPRFLGWCAAHYQKRIEGGGLKGPRPHLQNR